MSLNWPPIREVAARSRFWTDFFWTTETDHGSEGYPALTSHRGVSGEGLPRRAARGWG